MINEFFKSIFRTLGRIVAYILLGVLVYFILNWFGLPHVKAQSYNNGNGSISVNNYLYDTNNNYITNAINSGVFYPNGASYNGGNLITYFWQNNQVPQIATGSYQINITFVMKSQYSIGSATIQPSAFTFTYSGGLATCDGTATSQIVSLGAASDYGYLSGVNYQCTRIDITTPTILYFKFTSPAAYPFKLYGYTDVVYQLLDLNDTSNDTQLIISNNRSNTDRIINALSSDIQATKDAIEAMEAQLHQDLASMISDAEQHNQELIDTFTDDSAADLGFMELIADWMPIDTPVTDIITLPISILNKTINSLGGTCQPYTINTGSLLGNYSWTFPCLNIGQYFTNYSYQGFNLWQLIDLMICLFMGYEILMLIISAYNSIASLDDTFDSLYQPKHVGYAMKHGEGRL